MVLNTLLLRVCSQKEEIDPRFQTRVAKARVEKSVDLYRDKNCKSRQPRCHYVANTMCTCIFTLIMGQPRFAGLMDRK